LINSESYFPQLREYSPRAFGTWAIFPQLREIRLTIYLDASHYLYTVALDFWSHMCLMDRQRQLKCCWAGLLRTTIKHLVLFYFISLSV